MLQLMSFAIFSLSAQLLDTACKMLPLVVTVSGRVGSETPIDSEYSGLRGVILEQTVNRLFLTPDDFIFFSFPLGGLLLFCNIPFRQNNTS